MSDVVTTSKSFESVLDSIENKNYVITIPKMNEKFSFSDMKFKVLYTGTDESDLNNTSIVLKLTYGNNSFLFTLNIFSKSLFGNFIEKKMSFINYSFLKNK